MTLYPLLFEPLLKERVWGGTALTTLGKRLPIGKPVGESWELADLPEAIPGGRSIIANGPLAGRTLHDLLKQSGAPVMGSAALGAGGVFPLLIKYLDARENLSVQVHPSPAYAAAHPEAAVKSEAWVVIRSEPGALIYRGVKPQVAPRQFLSDVHNGSVIDDLIAVPARAGDCHYLPSGTCHALGAGILVAEIQTPSDTTFRVFDWGRPKTAGRELHLEQAMACISFGDEAADAAHAAERAVRPRPPVAAAGLRTTTLAQTDAFTIERLEAMAGATLRVVTSGQPVVWMILAGSARIRTRGTPMPEAATVDLPLGATALIPARLGEATAELPAKTTLLRITLPAPTRGMIAGLRRD